MAPAAHRRPRTGRLRRRASGITLAGAVASVSSLAVAAPAQADGHNVWDRVAECESNGRWSINTGNGFYGGLQFWHPTWTGFGGAEFAPYAHQAAKLQQITVAQRVLKVQGPGAWPVCSVRAGLTMENGSAPYPGTESPAPAPAPAPAPEPPAESSTFVVTASAGANIRSGPSTSYAVVGGAAHGTKLSGVISTNGWLRLADGGRWVSGTIVAPASESSAPAPAPTPAPAPAPAPPAASSTYVVTASAGANIRSGPSTSYAVVGGAAHGTKLTGEISTNGWLKLADRRGWISGTIVGPVSSGSGSSSGTTAMAPLAVDGSRGPLTVKAIQRWVGVSETGRWDTSTIKALQRTVGTEADGLWGPASQAALQQHVGLSRDGSTYMNYRTVVALQKWLNANVIG